MSNTPPTEHSLKEKPTREDLTEIAELEKADGVQSYNGISFTPEEANRAQWKIDTFMLGTITLYYFLSFLDRGNIGNAKVAGLQTDLGLSSNQYSLALTVTFIPYILIEVPVTLLLKRMGPDRVLPILVTLWGVVTLCQGSVTNMGGLCVCRFFLGLLEGGLTPGSVLLFSCYYRRAQLQKRIALYFGMVQLAGAFSGLLAYGITLHLDGAHGHSGWRYIFWIEGAFTAGLGIITGLAHFIPRSPTQAWYLSPAESAALQHNVAKDNWEYVHKDTFTWKDTMSVWFNPAVIPLMLIHTATGFFVFGLAYFVPPIVAGLGYTNINAQLMTVPPNFVGFLLAISTAVLGDRLQCRGLILIFGAFLGLIGYIMNLTSHNDHIRYGALFLQVGSGAIQSPTETAWGVTNVSGHLRRATYLGFGFALTNVMGIGSVWAFPSYQAPFYHSGSIVGLICATLVIVASVISLPNLIRINRKRERKIEELGPNHVYPEGVIDDRDVRFRFSY